MYTTVHYTRVQGNGADVREHLSLGKHSSCSKILPILNNFSLFSSPWKDEGLTLQLSLEHLQLSLSWPSFLLGILQERSLSDTMNLWLCLSTEWRHSDSWLFYTTPQGQILH